MNYDYQSYCGKYEDIYKTSEHIWNVYKSHIMVFFNYDCRAHLVFHGKWKKIMTSGQMWKIKYTTSLYSFRYEHLAEIPDLVNLI